MPRSVVIDIGTGYSKIGFSGNIEPQFIIPTCVASKHQKGAGVVSSHAQAAAEMDFYIGDEAYGRRDSGYLLQWPVQEGRIKHWDDMERFLQQAIFRNLRVSPEEHNFLLTESPFNPPENRELMAEIMFETFGAKGLNISVQAVLALYAQWVNDTKVDDESARPNLTGLVVDSGDGLTHVIPIGDGYVINSCIQSIPFGGKHVTEFVNQMLQDRGEPVPPEQRMEVSRQIKEKHSYLCKDIVAEYQKYDQDPARFKTFKGVYPKTNQAWEIQIGYERFLAPELFFHPEIFTETVTQPLPEIVDKCIQNCPIDYRRRLYGNVVLSGGSTTFTHFKERLQHDVQGVVDRRLSQTKTASGKAPEPIEVKVHGSPKRAQQRFAAWLGGSLFAAEDSFESHCKTKKEYDEVGPACMRNSSLLHGG
jgi:actin-related protein 3